VLKKSNVEPHPKIAAAMVGTIQCVRPDDQANMKRQIGYPNPPNMAGGKFCSGGMSPIKRSNSGLNESLRRVWSYKQIAMFLLQELELT
jgi:hypothetical protein